MRPRISITGYVCPSVHPSVGRSVRRSVPLVQKWAESARKDCFSAGGYQKCYCPCPKARDWWRCVYGLVRLGPPGFMVKVGGKVDHYYSLGPEPLLFDQHSKFLRCQPLGNSPFVRDSWLGCQGQDVQVQLPAPKSLAVPQDWVPSPGLLG